MTTLELQGQITEDGELKLQLPAGLPAGNVTVRIDLPNTDDWDQTPWTEEEIRELMKPNPRPGKEIAAMLRQTEAPELVDPEITDPVEWVKVQRRKEADRLRRYWEGKE